MTESTDLTVNKIFIDFIEIIELNSFEINEIKKKFL
jgi:hypothetical protein